VDDERFAHVVTQFDHQVTIVKLQAREVVQIGGAELLDRESSQRACYYAVHHVVFVLDGGW
jgi:hypothetical protein